MSSWVGGAGRLVKERRIEDFADQASPPITLDTLLHRYHRHLRRHHYHDTSSLLSSSSKRYASGGFGIVHIRISVTQSIHTNTGYITLKFRVRMSVTFLQHDVLFNLAIVGQIQDNKLD